MLVERGVLGSQQRVDDVRRHLSEREGHAVLPVEDREGLTRVVGEHGLLRELGIERKCRREVFPRVDGLTGGDRRRNRDRYGEGGHDGTGHCGPQQEPRDPRDPRGTGRLGRGGQRAGQAVWEQAGQTHVGRLAVPCVSHRSLASSVVCRHHDEGVRGEPPSS